MQRKNNNYEEHHARDRTTSSKRHRFYNPARNNEWFSDEIPQQRDRSRSSQRSHMRNNLKQTRAVRRRAPRTSVIAISFLEMAITDVRQ